MWEVFVLTVQADLLTVCLGAWKRFAIVSKTSHVSRKTLATR